MSSVMAAVDAGNLVSDAIYWDFLGSTSGTVTASDGSSVATLAAAAGSGVSVAYESTKTGLKLTADSSKVAPKLNNTNNADISSKNHISIPVKAGDVVYAYAYSNSDSGKATLKALSSSKYIDEITSQVVSEKTGVTEVQINVPSGFDGSEIYIISDKNASYKGTMNIAAIVRVRSNVARYNVSGSVINGTTAFANKKFDIMSGASKVATATIDATGQAYTLDSGLANGTYSFFANWGDYTLTGNDVTVNDADITDANVTITKKATYLVSGSVTGVNDIALVAGKTFTLTNKTYSDITATATVDANGTTYSSTVDLVAGEYEISSLSVDNHSLKTPTITVSETGCTGIEFAYASKMMSSFEMSFANDISAGDLGNGVYACIDMTHNTEEKTFDDGKTISDYVQQLTENPTVNGSDVTGAAMKFVVAVDGRLSVKYSTGTVEKPKIAYFKKVDGNTLVDVADAQEGKGDGYIISADVKAGNTYYVYGNATKLRYYGIEFVTNVFECDGVVAGAGKAYVVGKIVESALDNADKVGFGAGLTAASAKTSAESDRWLDTDTVAKSVQDNEVSVKAAQAGNYFAAFEISGGTNGTSFWVVPFTTVGGTTAYGDAVEVQYQANAQ